MMKKRAIHSIRLHFFPVDINFNTLAIKIQNSSEQKNYILSNSEKYLFSRER